MLSEDDILDIQTSDEPAKVIGKRYGISHQKVNSLRKAADDGLQEKEAPQEVVAEIAPTESTGPAYGYRDGKDGVVEKCLFPNGVPKGWHKRPTMCKNAPKDGHADYKDLKQGL